MCPTSRFDNPPSILFGRDRELRIIEEELDGVGDRGRALLFRGDPGVGKSAILEAAKSRAALRGMPVLAATGVPSETNLPFAGLYDKRGMLAPRLAGFERDCREYYAIVESINGYMRRVNITEIAEIRKAKEGRIGFRRPISEALGRQPSSTDFLWRHPFDVELLRVPPHSVPYRYHSHSAQFEYYQVIIGEGVVRHADGETPVLVGDAFLFKPGEPHQIRNDSDSDLELLIVADNPVGESYYYPDDAMWIVNSPEPHYVALHPEREDPAALL